MTETSLKRFTLYDSIYITLSRRQEESDGEHTHCCWMGVGEGAPKKATRGRCFCDVGTILSLDWCSECMTLCICPKIHRSLYTHPPKVSCTRWWFKTFLKKSLIHLKKKCLIRLKKTWAPLLRRSDKHSPIHSPMSQSPSPAFMSGSLTDAQKVEFLLRENSSSRGNQGLCAWF